MKSIAFGSLALAVVTSFASCKTTNNPESSLADSTKVQEIGDEIFACYNVTKVESSSSLALVTKLKENSKELCIGRKPLNLVITDRSRENLLSWQFTEIEALRCPGCFRLKGANGEAVATITRTAVTLVYNLSLDSRGLGGNVRLMLQQKINGASGSDEAQSKFGSVACGNSSKKVTAQMPSKNSGASLKISGKAQPKDEILPANVSVKGNEWVFTAMNNSRASLRVISESDKLYGVYRDSNTNDEIDLGLCVADPKEEPMY